MGKIPPTLDTPFETKNMATELIYRSNQQIAFILGSWRLRIWPNFLNKSNKQGFPSEIKHQSEVIASARRA